MADISLSTLLSTAPVTEQVDGNEPIETVVNTTSRAFTVRQLSSTPIKTINSSFVLSLVSQGAVVSMGSSSDTTITVPPNADVGFAVGTTLLIRTTGTGNVTVVAGSGVSIVRRASHSLVLLEQYAQCVLHKINTNIWHITGELKSL